MFYYHVVCWLRKKPFSGRKRFLSGGMATSGKVWYLIE